MCEECGKMLTSTNAEFIAHHKKSVKCKQMWTNGVKCPICDKKLSSTSSLPNHIDAVHEKVRRNRCTECSFTTYSAARLRRHKLTHTGIYLYVVSTIAQSLQLCLCTSKIFTVATSHI